MNMRIQKSTLQGHPTKSDQLIFPKHRLSNIHIGKSNNQNNSKRKKKVHFKGLKVIMDVKLTKVNHLCAQKTQIQILKAE